MKNDISSRSEAFSENPIEADGGYIYKTFTPPDWADNIPAGHVSYGDRVRQTRNMFLQAMAYHDGLQLTRPNVNDPEAVDAYLDKAIAYMSGTERVIDDLLGWMADYIFQWKLLPGESFTITFTADPTAGQD